MHHLFNVSVIVGARIQNQFLQWFAKLAYVPPEYLKFSNISMLLVHIYTPRPDQAEILYLDLGCCILETISNTFLVRLGSTKVNMLDTFGLHKQRNITHRRHPKNLCAL